MKIISIILISLILIISCNVINDKTKRAAKQLQLMEKEIKFPCLKKIQIYSYFEQHGIEYFCYKIKDWIYCMNLKTKIVEDSINIIFEKGEKEKYGEVTSFCFSGSDSIFLLMDKAIFFVENKIRKKVIPINELDSSQFTSFRFANLENAPIYYDNKMKEIIGQVYCSTCFQSQKSFYKQKIVGSISIETGKVKLYNMSYPDIYVMQYYGFANHVYIDNYCNNTYLSFPCDPNIFILNRYSNKYEIIPAKSIFQNNAARPLDTVFANSREEKMKHMVTVPYYTELRYDKNREVIYRFYLKELNIKTSSGKYNSFDNKQLILLVLNKNNEVVGEYPLDKYYNNYISFVGKDGLYINYFSKERFDTGKIVFKILTFN